MSEAKKKTSKTGAANSKSTPGKRIGKYQNAVLLAKGGMGAIYKADHPTLEQPVVLKMLTLTGNDQFTQRFQREATIMMGFQHVNIVNYFDHFKTTKSYCMVMEYVDGCSLAQLLERHRYLDDDVAMLVLRDTLRALSFAHAKGVIHRDIKPANILISSKGEVKLTDFGIAHDQAVDTDGLTKEGMTLGTPSYMAPEQFRDAGTVDGRADVYSVGVLLYECLTGRKPFAGASLPEMLERIRKGRYEKLRKVRPESSGLSRCLVRRAMKPRPEWRYRDASRMLRPVESYLSRRNENVLREVLSDLVADRRRKDRSTGKTRRKIIRITLISLASLAGAAVLAGVWWIASVAGWLPSALLPDFLGAVRTEVVLSVESGPRPRMFMDVYTPDEAGEDRRRASLEVRSRPVPLPGENDEDQSVEKAEAGIPEEMQRLRTLPFALKPGLYKCVLRIGDEVFTDLVQIPSLKDRRRALEDGGSPVITLSRSWEPVNESIPVGWRITRTDTGNTPDAAAASLVVDGEIVKLRGNSVNLDSGGSYEFRFSAPGYSERALLIELAHGISSQDIDVALLPEPSVLELRSSIPFRRPRLQGERLYRHGGVEGGFRKIPVLRDTAAELLLPPGDYSLSCGPEGREAIVELKLTPGGRYFYALERNEERQFAWIEVDNE